MSLNVVIVLPAGPMLFTGLNAALKQTFALKQDTILPPKLQDLLRMPILSGVNVTLAVTTAIPLDLKAQSYM